MSQDEDGDVDLNPGQHQDDSLRYDRFDNDQPSLSPPPLSPSDAVSSIEKGTWAAELVPRGMRRNRAPTSRANIFDNDAGRYCGSGTSKYGVQARLSFYEKLHKGKVQGEPTKHSDWLKRKDMESNLRVVAVFDPRKVIEKPYLMLAEFLSTIMLQGLPKSGENPRRTASTLEMIRSATPSNVPAKIRLHLWQTL